MDVNLSNCGAAPVQPRWVSLVEDFLQIFDVGMGSSTGIPWLKDTHSGLKAFRHSA
jgi:hypothetical protein